jgi:ABC-type microcin C transport system duplicated ATPase subunit YejF
MKSRRELLGALALGGVLLSVGAQADVPGREEARMHPRIRKAIHELEDAIKYMEEAPHDFGGNKAQAIADSRAAVISLRKALAYRGEKDEHHGH